VLTAASWRRIGGRRAAFRDRARPARRRNAPETSRRRDRDGTATRCHQTLYSNNILKPIFVSRSANSNAIVFHIPERTPHFFERNEA
jgi:hypothetical protein